MGIKVTSLFDGASCGKVALDNLGFKIDKYDAYEIEEDAVKISKFNHDDITHKGDVFEAVYEEGESDLVIGGSPCTQWSVAKKNRETTSSGIGFDLFMQYARAIKEIKPKYFLYENNYRISKEIVEAITKELGVEPIMINSALVSAQGRKRYYWTNIPTEQPEDKGILLSDCVKFENHVFKPVGKWVYEKWGNEGKEKLHQLKTIHAKKSHTLTTSKTHPMGYYLNEEKTHYTNLTVNEFEALQQLPIGYVDNVDIKQTSKYRAIGNGWTVGVIEHIFKGLPDEYKN